MASKKVDIVNKSGYELPKYATDLSAGVDIRAAITGIIVIRPGHRALIPTGLFVGIPKGYEIQIRPRSGLAYKKGITVLNSPGTIDADYPKEVGVILINASDQDFEVNPGDRIAQMVLTKFDNIVWNEVEAIKETGRKGGFGHTGVK